MDNIFNRKNIKKYTSDDLAILVLSARKEAEFKKGATIKVYNFMQKKYAYTLAEAPGQIRQRFQARLHAGTNA